MKAATVCALLLILLGVAWCGESRSWVGTEGKWVEWGGHKMRMTSDDKGVQGRKAEGSQEGKVNSSRRRGLSSEDDQVHWGT